jgi:hypothetical protein
LLLLLLLLLLPARLQQREARISRVGQLLRLSDDGSSDLLLLLVLLSRQRRGVHGLGCPCWGLKLLLLLLCRRLLWLQRLGLLCRCTALFDSQRERAHICQVEGRAPRVGQVALDAIQGPPTDGLTCQLVRPGLHQTPLPK